MADQRILSTEKMVGAGHATLADTLNRLALVEHWNDGTHKFGKLLAYQHTQVTVTGTTNETTLFSTTIPGGTMGPNGTLQVNALLTCNSSATAKNVRLYFGGALVQALFAMTTSRALNFERRFCNRNAENSQVFFAAALSASFSNAALVPSTCYLTIDTAQDQTLAITGQLADGADSLTCEAVDVEVKR